MATNTSIGIVGRWRPVFNVGLGRVYQRTCSDIVGCDILAHLSIDKLQVTRALAVAVASSVGSTSLVSRVLGQTTVGVHRDEVQSSVQTTLSYVSLSTCRHWKTGFATYRKVGDIHVKSELLAQQLEHLVLSGRCHEVGTRANVGAAAVLGNKVQGEGVAARRNTVG